MSTIHFFEEDAHYSWTGKRQAKAWIKQCVQDHKQTLGTINIIFCSDEHLLGMNRQYLEHDYYTDIITFDNSESGLISGELFISIDRVKDNAEKLKTPALQELHRVMIHGVLHLLGYKDKSAAAAAKMRKAEDKYLTLLFDTVKTAS